MRIKYRETGDDLLTLTRYRVIFNPRHWTAGRLSLRTHRRSRSSSTLTSGPTRFKADVFRFPRMPASSLHPPALAPFPPQYLHLLLHSRAVFLFRMRALSLSLPLLSLTRPSLRLTFFLFTFAGTCSRLAIVCCAIARERQRFAV